MNLNGTVNARLGNANEDRPSLLKTITLYNFHLDCSQKSQGMTFSGTTSPEGMEKVWFKNELPQLTFLLPLVNVTVKASVRVTFSYNLFSKLVVEKNLHHDNGQTRGRLKFLL